MLGVKGVQQQGLVWVPYIIVSNVAVIESGTFSPSYNMASKYSKAYLSKESRRIKKIKNILNKKDP